MKRFVKKVIIFLIVLMPVWLVFPIVADPYNVFHTARVRDNGVEPAKNYIKMSYITANPDKFDAFIFGSSRVGALHPEKIEGVNCYNMTYSVGLPTEHLDNLKTMYAAGVKPKKVYVGVDVSTYTNDAETHLHDPIRMPYEYAKSHPLEFIEIYVDSAKAFRSVPTVLKHEASEKMVDVFYERGWSIDYSWKNMEKDAYVTESTGEAPDFMDQMDIQLGAISEMKELLEKNGAELIVFTLPMHEVTWRASVKRFEYKEFLKRLGEVTPYYDFGGMNEITNDTSKYVDPSHFNAEVGDMMIEIFNGGEPHEDGFGVLVGL